MIQVKPQNCGTKQSRTYCATRSVSSCRCRSCEKLLCCAASLLYLQERIEKREKKRKIRRREKLAV
jgi:hypothetical protein